MMKNLNRINLFLILVLSLLLFSTGNIFGQKSFSAKDIQKAQKAFNKEAKEMGFPILKGGNSTIPSIDPDYCSDHGQVDIVPDAWDLSAASITWAIRTNLGSVEFHPSWADVSGSGQSTVLEFHTDRVDPKYYGIPIYFDYYQYDGGGGPLTVGSDYTVIYLTPTAFNLSANTAICSGESATLTLDGSENGINYQLKDGGGSDVGFVINGNGNPIDFVVTPGVTTDYYVEAENASDNTCQTTMNNTVTVTVNSLPSASASNDGPVCEGEPITLSGLPTGMTSYSWSGPNGYTSTDQNPVIDPTVAATHAGAYTLTVVDGNTCSKTANTTVVINVAPTITTGSNSPICVNGTLNLTSTPSGGSGSYSTYAWTGPNSFSSTVQNPSITNITTAGAGDYFVTVTDDEGCSSDGTASETVVVNERPTVGLSYNNPVCEGTALTLTATPTGGSGNYVNYIWTKGGVLISGENSSTLTIDPAAAGDAGLYGVTVEDDAGCSSDESTVTVTIHSLPVATASNNGPRCENDDITLNGGPNGMTTYSWTGPNSYTSSQQNPVLSNVTIADAGVYTLNIVDGNTCENSVTTTVVVNENPTITTGSNSPICVNGTLNLTSTPSGGSGSYSTYAWTGPNSFSSTVQNPSITNITTAGAGDYFVTVTDDEGCSSDGTASETVVVNERPTVGLSYNNPVCEGTGLTLTATPTGGSGNYVNYIWTKGGVLISGENSSTLTIDPAAAGDAGLYGVTVEDDAGCSSDESTVTVTIHSLPVATASNNGPRCENDDITLNGGPNGMTTYSWTGPNSYTSSQQNPVLSNVTIADAGVYTLNIVDGNTCENSVTTTVVVNENPTITTGSNSPICVNGTLNLTSTPSGGSGSYSTYAWTGPNSFSSTVQNPSITNITTAGAGDYFVTVTDDEGCSSDGTASETVVVNERPTVGLSYNNPVCEGTALTLIATPTGGSGNYVNYIWTKGGVLISGENSSTLTIDPAAAGDAGLYGVTVEDDAGCSSDESTVTVTIHSLPVATASNNGPRCENDDITLNGGPNGMTTYSWTGPNSYTSSQQNPVLSNVTIADAGVYTLNIVDGNTCENSVTTTVVVDQVNAGISVSAPAPGLTTICAGTSVTFNASATDGSGNYNYDFHLIRGGIDNSVQNGASVTFTTTALQDGDEVYVIVTDVTNTCTDTSGSIVMTVISNPVPTLTITSAGGNVVCLGTTVDFLASPSGYSRYVFLRNGTETLQDGTSNTLSTDVLVNGDDVSIIAYSGTCFGNSPSITMSVYDLPTASLVADKTTVCDSEVVNFTATAGGTGPFNYQFFVNNTPQGIQASNLFTYSSTNDFSVYAEVYDGNNCNVASSPVDITISKPVAGLNADVTTICEGDEVTFTASGGVQYEFFVGTTSVQGPGVLDEYKSTTLVNNDIVSVEVTDAFGCTASSTGITITVNPIPVVSISSSDIDNTICEGDEVTFTASGGDVYEFYLDGIPVQGPGSNDKYVTTALNDGEKVSALVSFSSSSCSTLTSEITTTVNPLPVATLSVSPSNTVISGTDLVFTGGGGTEYEFSVNSGGTITVIQARSSDDSYDTASGSYVPVNGDIIIVNVYDGNNCSSSSSSTLTIYDGVQLLDVSSTSIEYCEGDGGVSIYIATPQDGITYELLRTSDDGQEGASIMFDAANPVSVRWDNILGTEEYRVEGYYSSLPAERFEMNNRIGVTENALPTQYDLTPNGTVTGCNGGSGHDIQLSGSQIGFIYKLLVNGVEVDQQTGTGTDFTFAGNQIIGVYTISAEDNVSGCTETMNGTFEIESDGSDVAFNLYAINPADPLDPTDGRYCSGGSGVEIELDGSLDNTVNYKLYLDGSDTGVSVAGANGVISFGTVTAEGVYTVRVESSTGCQFPMDGQVNVSIIPNPTGFNLTADNNGHYCAGEVGVNIGLDDQEEDVEYVLFFNATTPLDTVIGTNASGTPFVFDGTYGTEGIYSVQAKVPQVDCVTDMTNTIDVVIDPLPIVYDASSNGDYCQGSSTYLNLPDSETGVEYRWHNTDDDTYGTWISGPGVLSFEINNSGTYEIVARKADGVTNCASNMNGSFVINEKPLPNNSVVIYESYEGTGCADGSVLTVVLSEPGVKYVLNKVDGGNYFPADVDTITGDGNDISFDPIVDSDNAEYTAEAILDGCSVYLDNSAFVDIIGVVVKQTVTGSGDICNGDPGVVFGLADSEAGNTYELYIADAVGSSSGTLVESIISTAGGVISFTAVNNEGQYYVVGVSSTCSLEMNNRVELNVNDLPIAYAMTGSGIFCDPADEVAIGLENSEDGVEYTLQYLRTDGSLRDTISVTAGAVTGAFDFGTNFTKVGTTYSVVAVNTDGCSSSMNGTVTIQQLTAPENKTIERDAVEYCEGSGGIELSINDPEADVIYRVIDFSDNSVVNEVTGTATGPLSLGNVIEGAYRFEAAWAEDACLSYIGDTVTITKYDTPIDQEVVSDLNSVCGNDSVTISLIDSEDGRKYRIEDSTGAIKDTITNTDRNPVSWKVTEPLSGSEIYEVWAMSGGICDVMMGTIEVTYKNMPALFDVSASNTLYCAESDSAVISIADTENDVAYLLVDTVDITTTLDVIIGNGDTQTYTKHFGAGGYTVKAILYNTGCSLWDDDTIRITKSELPVVNQDIFCGTINEPECAVEDQLCIDPSEVDVDYVLYNEDMDEVGRVSGTGAQVCFTAIDEAGDYSVRAESTVSPYCTSDFESGIIYEHKDFGELLAINDTLNVASDLLADTIVLRENDYLRYIPDGLSDSEKIPYNDEGFFSDLDDFVVDKLFSDYQSDIIQESESNIRYKLLETDEDDITSEVVEINRNIVGVYRVDSLSGKFSLNKTPGFYGKDVLRYVIYNTDYSERRDTATIQVYVGNEMIEDKKSFLIPNAFSPNGDGINDFFIISGINDSQVTAEKSTLEVFNRWGTLVYRSKATTYGEDDKWWDGKSTESNMVSIGSDLPNGTYYFIFSVKVNVNSVIETKNYKGYVELRR